MVIHQETALVCSVNCEWANDNWEVSSMEHFSYKITLWRMGKCIGEAMEAFMIAILKS